MKPILKKMPIILCVFLLGFGIQQDNAEPIPPPSCSLPAVEIIEYLSCIVCNCVTNEGYYMFKADLGWTIYDWSVSGGSIVYDFGSYIYIDKPGGGWLGVNVAAFKDGCDWTFDYWGVSVENCD